MEWFHGSPEQIDNWTTDYTGNGDDAEGAGIYFTTNYEDALGYSRKGRGDGFIYEVDLNTKRFLDVDTLPIKEELISFIKWADNYEDTLANWGYESTKENMDEAIKAYMNNDTHFEAIKSIEADFYKGDGPGYCSSMRALDYDGIIVKRNFMNTYHAIVWNPKIIRVLDTVEFNG